MAVRPSKSPETSDDSCSESQHHQFSSHQCFKQKSLEKIKNQKEDLIKLDCSCTNISIMHLFHEMKQIFPTVPDQIVHQCVLDNCHDREKCIKSLREELALHPTTAQIYPSQALLGCNSGNSTTKKRNGIGLNNQSDICDNMAISNNEDKKKLLLKPTRPAPVPYSRNCDKIEPFVNIKTLLENQHPPLPLNKNEKLYKNSELTPKHGNSATCNHNNIELGKQQSKTELKRPNTLNFIQASSNDMQLIKPTRRAPPPPTKNALQKQPTICLQPRKNVSPLPDQNFPSPYSDSSESEFSINISVSSPSSDHSKSHIQPLVRKVSTISIQPDPPYSRELCLNNNTRMQGQRSYTSLNLTLRQPGAGADPIDISAGPGLTYSSSSYDAKQGYQKQFLITVNDEGGVFQASQILRPLSCLSPQSQSIAPENQHQTSTSSTPQRNINYFDTAEVSNKRNDKMKYNLLEMNPTVTNEIIESQKHLRDQLRNRYKKNLKRLKQVQFEIQILTKHFSNDELYELDDEIIKLRYDCEKLINENEIIAKDTTAINKKITSKIEKRNKQPQKNLNSQLHYVESEYFAKYDESSPQWTCKFCTFHNDPLMVRCEKCDNDRDNNLGTNNITDPNMLIFSDKQGGLEINE